MCYFWHYILLNGNTTAGFIFKLSVSKWRFFVPKREYFTYRRTLLLSRKKYFIPKREYIPKDSYSFRKEIFCSQKKISCVLWDIIAFLNNSIPQSQRTSRSLTSTVDHQTLHVGLKYMTQHSNMWRPNKHIDSVNVILLRNLCKSSINLKHTLWRNTVIDWTMVPHGTRSLRLLNKHDSVD